MRTETASSFGISATVRPAFEAKITREARPMRRAINPHERSLPISYAISQPVFAPCRGRPRRASRDAPTSIARSIAVALILRGRAAGECRNRTYQPPCEGLSGFEDRASHQTRTLPRRRKGLCHKASRVTSSEADDPRRAFWSPLGHIGVCGDHILRRAEASASDALDLERHARDGVAVPD